MLKYTLRRLLETIPVTIGIVLLAFLLFNVVGGSPAATILGKNATAEAIAAFDHKWGYDQPVLIQFARFVGNLAKGDFGYSIENHEPVIAVLARGIGPTLSLTVPILFFGTLTALFFGILSAATRGRMADRLVLIVSTVLMSINYVVFVLAGQFFLGYKVGLFPIWGYQSAFYLVLPILIGILSSLGMDIRYFRTAILDELYKPYVLTARAKGLSHMAVLTRHVLPNALIPIVTYVSLSIPWLFTGSLLLEGFFGIPGLGSIVINAIHSSDMAIVRALVLIGALFYQFVNLGTDLLYAALDPRVRMKG